MFQIPSARKWLSIYRSIALIFFQEVAVRVAWLAGPEAGFVTGSMHTIDRRFGV